MFSGTCQKAYNDCSIVAARTRFLPPTHYLLLTSLIERRVRGAWRSKHAPQVERVHTGASRGACVARHVRRRSVACGADKGRGRRRVRCPRPSQGRGHTQCLRCSRPRAPQRCRASRLRLGRWPRPGRRSGRVCTASPHMTPPTQSSQAEGIPRLERA